MMKDIKPLASRHGLPRMISTAPKPANEAVKNENNPVIQKGGHPTSPVSVEDGQNEASHNVTERENHVNPIPIRNHTVP